MVKPIKIDYSPRTWQVEFHKLVDEKRFNVLIVHRRGGKTVAVLNELIKQALTCKKKNPIVAYVCPEKQQAIKNAWSYLVDYTSTIPGVKVSVTDSTIELPNGATIRVEGCDRGGTALRGAYFDFVILDEASDIEDENVWFQVIRPMLSDRIGKAVITGTVKGERFLWRMYEAALADETGTWGTLKYDVTQTNALAPAEIDSLRATTPWDAFQQEYMNNPYAAVKGAYWGETIKQLREERKITHVPYVKGFPVYAGWDMGGLVDPMVVWFMQYIDGEPRLFDYLKMKDCTIDQVCAKINAKPYSFAKFYLPHDANVHIQHKELNSKKRIIEDLCGVPCRVVEKPNSVEDIDAGIRAVDIFLSRSMIDHIKCGDGIADISLYTAAYDRNAGVFSQRPKKSRYEDSADALRTLVVGFKPAIEARNPGYGVRGAYDPYKVNYDVQNDWDVYNYNKDL